MAGRAEQRDDRVMDWFGERRADGSEDGLERVDDSCLERVHGAGEGAETARQLSFNSAMFGF